MKIAFVTDALVPPARGNGTTVGRWIEHLLDAGHDVRVLFPEQAVETRRGSFDCVHGYHAGRAGPAAAGLAKQLGVPLAISLGGTDLWALEQGEATERRALLDVLAAARTITGAFASFKGRLAGAFAAAGRASAMPAYRVVRRSVDVDAAAGLYPRPDDTLEIVLPAGLRPVKDPLLAIEMADRLAAAGLPVRLAILGSDLDAIHARVVRTRALASPHVAIGRRSPLGMALAYLRSHAVWNTSLHEGGANGILEGLAHGCAAFVRDTPGNCEWTETRGSPVVLFADADAPDLLPFHRALWKEHEKTRADRWAHTLAWLRAFHAPADERTDLLTAYASLFAQRDQ